MAWIMGRKGRDQARSRFKARFKVRVRDPGRQEVKLRVAPRMWDSKQQPAASNHVSGHKPGSKQDDMTWKWDEEVSRKEGSHGIGIEQEVGSSEGQILSCVTFLRLRASIINLVWAKRAEERKGEQARTERDWFKNSNARNEHTQREREAIAASRVYLL